MTVDLNNAVDDFLQWDFAVTHSGRTVSVRPLTLGDFAAISNPNGVSIATMAAIFAEPAKDVLPWLAMWRPEHFSAAVAAINLHLKEVMSKNSQAIASNLAKAMALKNSAPASGSSMHQ